MSFKNGLTFQIVIILQLKFRVYHPPGKKPSISRYQMMDHQSTSNLLEMIKIKRLPAAKNYRDPKVA